MSLSSVVLDPVRRFVRREKWRRSKGIRIGIAVALTLILSVLFPQTSSRQNVTGISVGALWTSADVTAPFSFPLLKESSRYTRDVRRALEDHYPVYLFDSSASVRMRDSLRTALTQWSSHTLTGIRSDAELVERISALALKLYDTTLLADQLAEEILSGSKQRISVRKERNTESLVETSKILSREAYQNHLAALFEEKLSALVSDDRRDAAKICASVAVPKIIYSQEKTDEARESIIRKVPRTDGIIAEGETIIAKGDMVTPEAKAALESLAEARIRRGGVGTQLGRTLGTIGHVAIIVMLFVLYVKFIRRKIYKDNAQLILIALILIFPAALAFLSVQIHTRFPLEYLILIPVTSMLLTILFDSRTGFYGTVIVALLVAGIRGNDYNVALAGLAAGAFAAYTVRDLRSRSQLFKSIWYIFLGYLISISALSFERAAPLAEIGLELAFAAGNALISPVLTFALVYAIESVFETLSELKLTEYDNINHPLLRRLADEAPGTYHHTMTVAQLAENAAIAIGANSLLAKIGAYFHDIGKMAEPEDFIENQSVEGNVHDELSPAESARRIRDHVLRGIELGRAEHLPEKVIDFIPMHHGTLRISYFYEKALESQVIDAELNDAFFRYPGPKPDSKETAIVMLADAAEAVARTLDRTELEQPTAEMLEARLDDLIRSRIADGQLDHSDLTLRDLAIIRTVFARLLIGTFHTRINYPTSAARRS